MSEKPILFSGAMVRAILAGRKTQTRRLMSPKPSSNGKGERGIEHIGGTWWRIWSEPLGSSTDIHCPFGEVGGRLWVKETFAYTDHTLNIEPGYVFRATDPDWSTLEGFKWKPSIFMPRAASRITLAISGVRVERLQDITPADCQAEGLNRNPEHPKLWIVEGNFPNSNNPVYAYQLLWESINGDGSWEDNPWVWVVTFLPVNIGN